MLIIYCVVTITLLDYTYIGSSNLCLHREHLERHKILLHCDNQAVVSLQKMDSTHTKEAMALIRLPYFSAVRYDISERFKQLVPQAESTLNSIPAWSTQSFIRRQLMQYHYLCVAPSNIPVRSLSIQVILYLVWYCSVSNINSNT